MVLKVADHGPGESVRREGEFYMKYLVGIPGRPTLYARGTVLGINGKNLEFLLLEDMGTPLAEDLEELDEMSRQQLNTILKSLEDRGINHGDIAARNLTRRLDGSITVVDFGEADHWD